MCNEMGTCMEGLVCSLEDAEAEEEALRAASPKLGEFMKLTLGKAAPVSM